jgi:hypothetical protein
MTIQYRLLDVDLQALNGLRFQLVCTEEFMIFQPVKAGQAPVVVGQAVKSRRARTEGNGQPATAAEVTS